MRLDVAGCGAVNNGGLAITGWRAVSTRASPGCCLITFVLVGELVKSL